MRRVFGLILICLLVLLTALGVMLVRDMPPGATGGPHPEIAGLMVAKNGADRLVGISGALLVFHAFLLILAGLLIAVAVPEARRTRGYLVGVTGLCGITLLVAGAVWTAYFSALGSAGTDYSAGFPVASARMMYGHWSATLLYDVFFIAAFRIYFFHPDDDAAFEALKVELATGSTAAAP